MPRDYTLLQNVIQCEVARASRKYWWADLRDLNSEAWVAALAAADRYTEKAGHAAPWTWVSRNVRWELTAWVTATTSPVHQRSHARFTKVRTFSLDTPEAEVILASEAEPPDQALADAQARAAIQRVVAGVIKQVDPDGLAAPVLLDGAAPAEVAAARGVPVLSVYRAAARVKRALYKNREAAALLEVA
jgi:DNA-directed RNA polymerase specialized sigma24 family protein